MHYSLSVFELNDYVRPTNCFKFVGQVHLENKPVAVAVAKSGRNFTAETSPFYLVCGWQVLQAAAEFMCNTCNTCHSCYTTCGTCVES